MTQNQINNSLLLKHSQKRNGQYKRRKRAKRRRKGNGEKKSSISRKFTRKICRFTLLNKLGMIVPESEKKSKIMKEKTPKGTICVCGSKRKREGRRGRERGRKRK